MIDSDFDYERREEVIDYIKNKYGADNIAHIIAKGRLTTRAVCRKVLSVYNVDSRLINQISKSIPEDTTCLEHAYSTSEEFKAYMDERHNMYQDMLKLEDMISHVSKHAAGIVVCPKPISEVVPCMSDGEDRTMLMTQWDKHEVEDVGLYKFDFLGLKTLTKLRKTVEFVKQRHNINIDLSNIDLEDTRLYDTLNSGKMSGIFQFEGEAGEVIIKRIKPRCFEDVVAAEALCRPGVKERDLYISNKEQLEQTGCFPVPEYWDLVKDVLEPTYGAIVYQEQTMLLMHNLAGWSLGKADKMRKVKNLEEFREEFVSDCFERGISSSVANSIYSRFDLGYSFNKSHAVAYAVNTMKTVYCRTYYFEEFMSAVMTIELDASEPCLHPLVKECQAHGCNILPPDINESTHEFIPTENGIRFPITLIKGVGGKAVEAILNNRPYTNLEDFRDRTPKSKVKINQIKNLIKAGAFDSINFLNRSMLLRSVDSEITDVLDEDIKRRYELESLGFVLTCSRLRNHTPTNWNNVQDESQVTLPCVIESIRETHDKNGNLMAFLNIETSSEFIPAVVFSRVYNVIKRNIYEGKYCMLHGKKNNNSLIINTVSVL